MKNIAAILAMGLAVAAVMACGPSSVKGLKTEIREYQDSTAHSNLSIKAELPIPGQGEAARNIRAKLIEVMDGQLSHIGSYEETRLFPPYEGGEDDTDRLLGYYREKALEAIGILSQEDYDERISYIEDLELLDDMPDWEYDFSLTKSKETERYVVFLSNDYVYQGGAHGGIIGQGGLTFDKEDGLLVEEFLQPDCQEAIQPLLRKGLTQYFSGDGITVTPEELDDFLLLETGLIPLPAWTPFPSEEGLVFTYQQYEIAAYAAGMPNFSIPYEEILPFLTPEAKALLDL
ncbi:MAG: RsiV family protein [Bacteroidales bacterium]|nr:RsiV family protein [Bacteroidales bacterium]